MKSRFKTLSVFLLLTHSVATFAAEPSGVTVGGTRLVYNGGKKEASIRVDSTDTKPNLIQSWIEIENTNEKAPFIVTPPLFRLDGGRQNILRVVRTGGSLPEDRESLYWLNIKSIPSGADAGQVNTLQIAVKTRIKLLYRPKGIKGTPDEVANQLTWQTQGNKLEVKNPTPFYMNFYSISVGGRELKDVTHVAPFDTATFSMPGNLTGQVTWQIINDYGGISDVYPNKK